MRPLEWEQMADEKLERDFELDEKKAELKYIKAKIEMKLYTAKQIAEITGLTLDNVRVRIHRLQIQPAQRFDNKPLYDREAVERVRSNK